MSIPKGGNLLSTMLNAITLTPIPLGSSGKPFTIKQMGASSPPRFTTCKYNSQGYSLIGTAGPYKPPSPPSRVSRFFFYFVEKWEGGHRYSGSNTSLFRTGTWSRNKNAFLGNIRSWAVFVLTRSYFEGFCLGCVKEAWVSVTPALTSILSSKLFRRVNSSGARVA